jgi:hypothetical protein
VYDSFLTIFRGKAMIVGFNHNINYRGVGFHVQTEDSGVKNPHLITLLYHAGTIIASQKTVYADILKVDNLSRVVEALAKDQHKAMLRRLTKGEFDQRIVNLGISLRPAPAASGGAVVLPTNPLVAPTAASPPELSLPAAKPLEFRKTPEPARIVAEPIIDKFRKSRPATSLDELIYAYLSGADEP